jgi:hypothetical protein
MFQLSPSTEVEMSFKGFTEEQKRTYREKTIYDLKQAFHNSADVIEADDMSVMIHDYNSYNSYTRCYVHTLNSEEQNAWTAAIILRYHFPKSNLDYELLYQQLSWFDNITLTKILLEI